MRRYCLPLAALCLAAMPGLASAELFAAIAYSPATGMAGTAWNFDTQTLAETEAGFNCGSADCGTIVVFTQCGAIAVGDGNAYGFSSAGSLAAATEGAMSSCDGFTTSCEITAAFCNDGF